MGHKTFPWSAAPTHINVLRRIHGIDDGRESREGVAGGWEKVWFSCKYLEVTQSTLEERLDLEIHFLAAARYFAHKRQIRSAQVNRSSLMTSASA